MKRRLFLSFPQKILGEPLLYTLGRDFKVVPNIQGASISKDEALMALEMEGDPAELDRAVAYLRGVGVNVDVLKENAPDRI